MTISISSSSPPAGGVDADRLRAAMGRFATGVTVITTRDDAGRPFGTTANAVSSVSLRPPLVLACLREESETLAALLRSRRFAINVLHRSQSDLSHRFARRAAQVGPAFWDGVGHRTVGGLPLLEGAIATVRCELHDVADGGDHTVVVGHVVDVEQEAEADPLLFYAGAYHAIGEPVPAPGVEVALPARDGALRMLSLSEDNDATSVAVLTGDPRGRRGVLLYPHRPCLLGDALGATGCPSRARLDAALSLMRAEGCGVAVYHRDRGQGLAACCALGSPAASAPLSDATVSALARAVTALDLSAVRLIAGEVDGRRAARAGVPVAALVDAALVDAPLVDAPPAAAAGHP